MVRPPLPLLDADWYPRHGEARRGFGTRVMESVIWQMNGDMRFDWRVEGLACEIAIPT